MQGGHGDWNSGHSEFDFINSQITDRSETSTDNGSVDFNERDDTNSLSDSLSPRGTFNMSNNNSNNNSNISIINNSLNMNDDQLNGYYDNNNNNTNNNNLNMLKMDELSPRGGNKLR